MRRGRSRVAFVALAAGLALSVIVAGCDRSHHSGGHPGHGHHGSKSPKPAGRSAISFAVTGNPDELAAYRSVVDAYDKTSEDAKVSVIGYTDQAALATAAEGAHPPDVFLVDRGQLPALLADKATRPLGDLLDDRDVDFGDGYSRVALQAFSSDHDLQCMPWGISPMVIYYNRSLVDFSAMAAKGLDVPSDPLNTWDFDQFRQAAEFASRPRKGVAGFYVAPTLEGLAPFIDSGGGDLYDDGQTPMSLAFTSSGTRNALNTVLPVLADSRLTLSSQQLAEKSPLQWFEEGKLGMIAGFRSLVPQLRESNVDFDVIGMPRVDSSATVGDLSALCVSSHSRHIADAADFLAHLISAEPVGQVAQTGYLSPSNSTVALSDAFLQPSHAPMHAVVFNAAQRSIVLGPLDPRAAELDAAVAPLLQQLLAQPTEVDAITQQIDDTSAGILAPPSTAPTDSPTASSTP